MKSTSQLLIFVAGVSLALLGTVQVQAAAPDIWEISEPTVAVLTSSEITITYADADLTDAKSYSYALYTDDCAVLLATPSPVSALSGTGTTPTADDLDIGVAIDVATLFDSALVTFTPGASTADLKLCIRLDLNGVSGSITYRESNVNVLVNLDEDFIVSATVIPVRAGFDETVGDANLDLGITISGYQCTTGPKAVDTAEITQAEVFKICVDNATPGIKIDQLRDLTFTQGAVSADYVTAGVIQDDLVQVASDGDDIVISARIVTAFFGGPGVAHAGAITVSGTVRMADARRELYDDHHLLRSGHRAMQSAANGQDAEFSFEVNLAEVASGSAAAGKIAMAFASALAAVVAL